MKASKANIAVIVALYFVLGLLLFVPGVASAVEEITDDTPLNCYDYREEPTYVWQTLAGEVVVTAFLTLDGMDYELRGCFGDRCFSDAEMAAGLVSCEPEPGPPPTTMTETLEVSTAF